MQYMENRYPEDNFTWAYESRSPRESKHVPRQANKKQFYDVSGGVRIISDQAAYNEITSFVSYLDGLDSSIVDYVGGFEVK